MEEAAPTVRSRDASGRWSVSTYLGCIVVAVVVVFAGAGVLAARQAMRAATHDATVTADSLSSSAARLVGDSLSVGHAQLAAVASSPGILAVLDGSAPCQLSFRLDLSPRSRIEVVTPDGRVVCSSSPAAPATNPSASLSERRVASGSVSSRTVHDTVAGELAVTFFRSIPGADGGPAGTVAIVVPTERVAVRLRGLLGGGPAHHLALVEGRSGVLLSTSRPPSQGDAGTGDVGLPVDGATDELASSRLIPGTSWRAVATISPDAALGPVRSLLLRGAGAGGAAMVVLLGSLAVVNRRIARPLRLLSDAVSSSGPAGWDALDDVRAPEEIVQLAQSFRDAVVAHEAYEDQLTHQALHDPLTGLPNRVLLAERLAHSLERASRSGAGVGVLFLDVDGFKLVNDSLGHPAGDEVLVETARHLTAILRAGDTLARFGGDEFVIVGEGLHEQAQAERLAVRAMAAVQTPIEIGGSTVRVSASIGIAIGDGSSTGADLVRDADNAMYLAKERGRSRHEVFDRPLRDRVTRRLTVANELRAALERQELHLVYQPQIDLTTQQAIGVEALLRWEHPVLGVVPPSTFIPIAEDIGMMLPIGRFVLDAACRQAAAWQAQGIDLVISVNLSGRQLAEVGLVDHVATVLSRTGMTPTQLCLELTESVLMSDTARAAQTLAALHDLGVQLSIDDFGTGYSSLAYLHRFPVDELKIDRTFVQDLTERPDQRTLVTAMVAMGSALGLGIIAEGVETVGQATLLRALGCPTAQGYLFSAPELAGSLGGILREGARVGLPPAEGSLLGVDLREAGRSRR